MTQKQNKVATKVMGLLAVISLLIIFRNSVFSLVDKVIVPITECVLPNSYLVLAVTILFVVSAYLAKGLLLYRKSYLKHLVELTYLERIGAGRSTAYKLIVK